MIWTLTMLAAHHRAIMRPKVSATRSFSGLQDFTRIYKYFPKIADRGSEISGLTTGDGGGLFSATPGFMERQRGFTKRTSGCVRATIHPSPQGPPGFPLPPGLLQSAV